MCAETACPRRQRDNEGRDLDPDKEKSFRVEYPHSLPADEVIRQLGGARQGLTDGEATRRREAVGPNRLPAPPKEGLVRRFLKHFNDLLIYILLVAAVVTMSLGHWVDTGVILAVLLANAVI